MSISPERNPEPLSRILAVLVHELLEKGVFRSIAEAKAFLAQMARDLDINPNRDDPNPPQS